MRQTSRGGSGRINADVEGTDAHGDPAHIRDVSLCSRAHAKMRSMAQAKYMAGDAYATDCGRIRHILRNLCASLAHNPFRLLTDRQREMCMRILGLAELPPLPEAHVPEVLRNLPKRPPGKP